MATESEYVNITDLANVRAAKAVLREVVPDCCGDCIPKSEWQQVMQLLMKWDSN